MAFGIYLFGLTHGQGHQIAQKGKGLPGAGRKKGKNTKQNKKVGREYNHRTHKSLTFRLFGQSQRSTAIYQVSAGTFIAIREGDPPQLPHVHKVPQAKSFIFFPTHRPHSTPKHIQRNHCKQRNSKTTFAASTLPSSNQIPRKSITIHFHRHQLYITSPILNERAHI